MSDYVIRKDENGNEVRMPLPLEEYVIIKGGKVPCIGECAFELDKWINPNDDPENVFMHPNTLHTLSNGVKVIYQKSDNGIEGCYTLVTEDKIGQTFECSYGCLKIPKAGENMYDKSIWSDMCVHKGVFKYGKFRNGITYIPTGYATFHIPEE